MPVYRRKYRDKAGDVRLGHYYFKFVVDGEVYKETVPTARTKKQAEEAERQARQAVHDGVYGTKGKRQPFSAFVQEVYLPHVEQHNRDFYHYQVHARTLCEYFKGRSLGQVSPLAVESFKRERLKTPVRGNKPRKPRAVNAELTTLSAVFSLAVRLRQLRENPCRKVKWLEAEEGPSRRLSAEEEAALLESAESEQPYLAPMIRLALWTGFRQGELIALQKSAVDLDRNRVFVTNPKWRKDKRKTEGNPMSPQVRELLTKLCETAGGELLFTDGEGRRLKRHNVRDAFHRACVRAGIEGLRFHDLRHEYGSRLGDSDVNLKKIARLMGHSNTKQTERYVHPTDDGLLQATTVAERPESSRNVPRRLKAIC
ncbi:MAG TPA: site-specific integrase [Pyrinomonadaceae bacterium]|jgi:integrase